MAQQRTWELSAETPNPVEHSFPVKNSVMENSSGRVGGQASSFNNHRSTSLGCLTLAKQTADHLQFHAALKVHSSIAYIPVLIFLAVLLIFAWWMDKHR
jgi:hypothetical protein